MTTTEYDVGFDRDDVPVVIRKDGAYVLADTLVYRGSQGDSIIVPRGFVTDLATVPRFLTALVPIAGIHNRAAILHDLLCVELAEAYRVRQAEAARRRLAEEQGRPIQVPSPDAIATLRAVERISPADVDGLFRQCLRLLGVRPFRRTLYWVGVRWGAAANKARRPGWFRRDQFWPLIGWSLLLLPLIGVPAIVSAVWVYGGTGLGKLLDFIRTVIPGGGPPPPPPAQLTREALAERRKP